MHYQASNGVPLVDLRRQHQPLQAEITAAINGILERGDFVLGQALTEFEARFAEACGVRFAIGMGSGTDAITLGLNACGISEGDEVILPANTFVATLIGVIRAGALPVLVDCDRATALMDLTAVKQAMTPRTRAVIPVHLYGQMVSPRALLELTQGQRLLIFEDAAQAHLASREGCMAGAVGVGGAFSFYPSKNLGALGDGGILVTSDPLVNQTEAAGFNSRLDTLQAAVLNLKLPYLKAWNENRRVLAQHYDRKLEPLQAHGVVPIRNDAGKGHVYHLYVIRITAHCPVDRSQLQRALAVAKIQTGIHYPVPCHLQPAFRSLGYALGSFPRAEALSQEVLSLPMYPGLTLEEVERVVAAITAAVTEPQPASPGVSPLPDLAP